MGRRRAFGAVVAVAVAVALLLGLAPATTAAPSAEPEPVHGVTLVRDDVLPGDGRLHELTLRSEALRGTTKVRLLLPTGYDDPARAATRYPMLLLLHGAGSSERTWTEQTDVEERTAPLGLIVVMPDGGRNGFYTDWYDGPRWETYHIRELLPWVDATYRTAGRREGRAVAGLSMGGFGSTTYASRNQDLFAAVAAFSGAVDLADAGVAEAAALQALGFVGDQTFGPYLTHEANWRGHNPADLAVNLRGMPIRLTTGTGVPCVGDRGPDQTEAGVMVMTAAFTLALERAGIPYELVHRLCGTHQWHYWGPDLAAWLPKLMDVFAHPTPPPAAFDDRFVEGHEDIWGWSFTAHRPATEFVDLRAVSPAGLTATGSGLLDVVTPPVYEPGATYRLASSTTGVVSVPLALVGTIATVPPAEAGAVTAEADAEGRLGFTLDLGPAHTVDQYSPEGVAAEALGAGAYFHTATVAIEQVASAPAQAAAPTPATGAGSRPQLPATGGPGPSWPLVALALAAAFALRRFAAIRAD